jgi:UDP-N-acetylmuramate--alanine ligase
MHKKEETWLHFVGVGGIGMSGIAEVFLNQGYRVSGSDLVDSETTRRLTELGAKFFLGHRAENVGNAQVVVVSSAVRHNNPELLEARRLRIPVIPRAEMLGELMRGKIGIAVAGTHGKTTTTSMLATILTEAGLDPTLVIGGKVNAIGGNAKLGQGRFVVAEADESDGSFLHLPATFGVITNIDNDHLDHFGSLSAIEEAFISFVGKLPFYGFAAVCGDDPGIKRCLGQLTKPYLTYGLSEDSNVYTKSIEFKGMLCEFKVFYKDPIDEVTRDLGLFQLSVPGRHNVLNALASIAIAMKLDIAPEVIRKALRGFRGVRRRFEVRWEDSKTRRMIVDDYGHHPTEISATLAAARNVWPGRVISVFQPHRYSRTLHCKDGFLAAFTQSDVVILTDIYSAGEDPIPGVDSETLSNELKRVAHPTQMIIYAGDLKSTQTVVQKIFTDGDLVICMGAGSIPKLSEQLVLDLVPVSV